MFPLLPGNPATVHSQKRCHDYFLSKVVSIPGYDPERKYRMGLLVGAVCFFFSGGMLKLLNTKDDLIGQASLYNEAGTTGNWILDNGTYYFTVGNGAHEAVNNVLAAQDQKVDGNKDNVQTWELGDFDSSSFAVTLNGTPGQMTE